MATWITAANAALVVPASTQASSLATSPLMAAAATRMASCMPSSVLETLPTGAPLFSAMPTASIFGTASIPSSAGIAATEAAESTVQAASGTRPEIAAEALLAQCRLISASCDVLDDS
ncbi:hypothetical protein CXG81DRAFT_23039 [Caulochytrium protostelioides]|nr:hypothetical protein CXG81DRAFT_23039 [Caulochytrium protostelioides]|eukprot:RKP04263.1 hypothetical protein CXG81DRAFT_23039 [Caulochytrium protostelioides]